MVPVNINEKYPIHLWLLTIAIAPVLFFIIGAVFSFPIVLHSESYILFIFLLLYGAFYSLPALLIVILGFAMLSRNTNNVRFIKVVLSLMMVLCAFLTVWVVADFDALDIEEGSFGLVLALSYSISSILSSKLCRITSKQHSL